MLAGNGQNGGVGGMGRVVLHDRKVSSHVVNREAVTGGMGVAEEVTEN